MRFSDEEGEDEMKRKSKCCCYLIAASLTMGSAFAVPQVIEGETGSGAKYQITVPDNWNGDLVEYAHGIVVDSTLPIALPTVDDIEALRDMLVDSGYAVAYSSYSKNGFAVREGVLNTRNLDARFIRHFGQPERTFLIGHSLGGAVCARLVELYPGKYDGVLTVAGMIGGSQAEIDYISNVRILWEFFYPGVLPGGIDDVPEEIDVTADIVIPIVTAVTMDPTGAGAVALIDQTPVPWDFVNPAELVESYATALGFWYQGYGDVTARTGGKGFYDNADTVYTSSYLPPEIMAGINTYVDRFEASHQAERYLWRYFEPTGKLQSPHLALHNSRDPAVPVLHQALYAEKVAEQGNSDLLVQRISDRYGHTAPYAAAEVHGAFVELVEWVDTGVAPAP
jgi:pimeloyl-ACP methyl ester carboxylesterase